MSTDELILAISNRATSRCYSTWMLPAQVGGAACILLWPLGAVAGSLGIVALVAMGAGTALAGLAMADQESNRIAQGDRDALAQYLTEDDLGEFKALATTAAAATEPPKPMGATPAPSPESGNTTQTPTPGSNADAAPVPTAPRTPVDRLLWRDGEHLVLIGLSGSSKTTTLVDCVPSTAPVIYITLKSEDKAPEGWRAYRLRKFADQAFLAQLDNLCSMLTNLVQAKAPHRLIIDEALTILDQAKDAQKTLTDREDKALYGAVAARFEGLLKMYIRTGRSDGHWLGLVTQSPNGTDLFGSAKTMQGLKTVLCAGEASSNRFDFVVAWAKQLYGQFLAESDEQRLRGIRSGFWHFWVEDSQIQYRATPLSDRAMVDIPMLTGYESLLRTATPDNPDRPSDEAGEDWALIAQQLLEQPSDYGLRRAASAIAGRNLAGVTWQKWRNEFAAQIRTLDADLQDNLIQRFPAVLG